jgi:hypothetical protein
MPTTAGETIRDVIQDSIPLTATEPAISPRRAIPQAQMVPFLRISAAVHPQPKPVGDTSTSKLTEMKSLDVTALYDTGAEVTRICGDVIGVALEQGELETCVFTFEYLPLLAFCHALGNAASGLYTLNALNYIR